MLMKWTLLLLLAAVLTLPQPLQAEARTSVFISVSVGGAAIVGGAYLFWTLTYGSRISGIEPGSGRETALSPYQRIRQDRETMAPASRFFPGHSEAPEDLTIRWPLFTYRW